MQLLRQASWIVSGGWLKKPVSQSVFELQMEPRLLTLQLPMEKCVVCMRDMPV